MLDSALVLCAGLGTRMRPITDKLPKPMVQVAGKPLLFYHLERLKQAGVRRVVINTYWLGEHIIESVKDGAEFGLDIVYSKEDPLMETGGGIKQALSLIEDSTFLVVNGDIWCDMALELVKAPNQGQLANLVMINNPAHNLNGDFSIVDGKLSLSDSNKKTFSGIACYHRDFFEPVPLEPGPLSPWFKHWIEQDKINGQFYNGKWCDVGTPERLEQIIRDVSSCQ